MGIMKRWFRKKNGRGAKRIAVWLVIFLMIGQSALPVMAQVSSSPVDGITTFNNIPEGYYIEYAASDIGNGSFTAANIDGWDITANTYADGAVGDTCVIAGENYPGWTDGGFIYAASNSGFYTIRSVVLTSNDKKVFDLKSIDLGYDFNMGTLNNPITFTIVGFKNGLPVNGASQPVEYFPSFGEGGVWKTVTLTPAFQGIDTIQIISSQPDLVTAIDIDNINAVNFRTDAPPPLVDAAAPVINLQPQPQNVNEGDSVTLSVGATGSTLSYQWYRNDTAGTNGSTMIIGATDPFYNMLASSNNEGYYYVVVTNTDISATGNQTAQITSDIVKVTVAAPQSSNADLSNLIVNGGMLDPEFSAGTTQYTAYVPSGVTSINVTPTTADGTATVTVNGVVASSGAASQSINLQPGQNIITIVVTAQDGTTKTYTFTIYSALSSNADLSNLTLSEGMLDPVFSSSQLSYSTDVGHSISSILISPTTADGASVAKVNGIPVASGGVSLPIVLNIGQNAIPVEVTAEDGTVKTYMITVNRAASSNADLSNLTVNGGTLDPVFTPRTTDYTVAVPNETTNIKVTPTVADGTATVKVNDVTVTSGSESDPISLQVGKNMISVAVQAEDGSVKTYTITVNRAVSSNANLSGLVLDQGTLNTAFSPDVANYSVFLANGIDSLAVTPSLEDVNATLTVNGAVVSSGQPSDPISLVPGTNRITIAVAAQDGMTTKTYTIQAVVAPAALNQISIVPGNGNALLNWTKADGADAYNIYRSLVSGTSWTLAGTVDGQSDSYNSEGLLNGTAYYFVVKAVNDAGESAASDEVSAIPFTTPGAPVNVKAEAGNGKALISFSPPENDGGRPVTGYEVIAYPGNTVIRTDNSSVSVTGLTNGNSYTFKVRAVNEAGSGTESIETDPVVPQAPYVPDQGVDILVNGKVEKIGTSSTSVRNHQSVMTIAMDQAKLDEKLAKEGQHAIITIPVKKGTDVVIGELNAEMISHMQQKEAILKVQSDRASYTLSAHQLNLDNLKDEFGKQISLKDIKIQIEVSNTPTEMAKFVEEAGDNNGFELTAPAVNFAIRGMYNNKSVDVSDFQSYVERIIALPDGIDPSKITTGIVVEPDGTVRHVPTKVAVNQGKYYAVVNSLTNSTYSLIYHPIEFKDVSSHWAKSAINDMGSRFVINGDVNGLFAPERDITRAEFSAILVRGLGLKLESGESLFKDVKNGSWDDSVIHAAYRYGLINGYEDGTFRPEEKISREQAMIILSRAMAVVELEGNLESSSAKKFLSQFRDANSIAAWEGKSIADAVQAGLINGRSNKMLDLKSPITRAETAVIIQRLLEKSKLI
ncbi:cadherin-like beta sandwich domain-containing protein [Falsibacillus pallidus]|uniref:Fibronectin type III domain protein n=1 Tax=Falsibacillus pallidus TaxID=493781 RepID=A0A370GEP3_9BACI|nr:cadherin-like beta sandwich domain-containing protein [Falsibacillus pallidus]RDI41676.1 fibronectin type III domain protein [Falsibacillus pallidus]